MTEKQNTLFPLSNSPQRLGAGSGNATGSLRNKVALPKGRSLMDWIRLGESGIDLTGVGGKMIRVTTDELKKHNTKDDLWMAIGGVVYNISKYCEYHPGGIDEIMKGAGKDATNLFNEVHRWVNYQSMLKKCIVGKLVVDSIFKQPPQYSNRLMPPRATGTSLKTVNKPYSASNAEETNPVVPFTREREPDKPRYDFFQNEKAVKLVIYSRRKGVGDDNVVVERPEGHVRITLYLPDDKMFKLHFEPSHPLLLDCKLHCNISIGKIEIDFPKAENGQRWTRLGTFLDGHNTLSEAQTIDYIDCVVNDIEEVSHDTKLYKISLPEGYHMSVPIGYHVRLKALVSGMEIIRNYTPVTSLGHESYTSAGVDLLFLIKIYADGALTPRLGQLQPGDLIPVSHQTGKFNIDQADEYQEVVLFAAGTGFTPMAKIINCCITKKKPCHLYFFNKTERDILWRSELDALSDQTDRLFSVTHVLSSPDTHWDGYKGRISSEMMSEVLPNREKTFVAVCGPIPFNDSALKILTEIGFGRNQVYVFQG